MNEMNNPKSIAGILFGGAGPFKKVFVFCKMDYVYASNVYNYVHALDLVYINN